MNHQVAFPPVKHGTAVSVAIINLNDYDQVDSFKKIELIRNANIPLRDVRPSHVTSFCVSFRLYDIDYSLGTQSSKGYRETALRISVRFRLAA